MPISIRPATSRDTETVSAILREAAAWLESRGIGMWRENELAPDRIAEDVASGQFFLAEHDGTAVGTVKFQLSDARFWPDMPDGDSVYIHRLAVRRSAARGSVSAAMLEWAAARGASLGRRHLRLDCEASRTRLRSFYESAGFRFHSERDVGPYRVARYQKELALDPPAAT